MELLIITTYDKKIASTITGTLELCFELVQSSRVNGQYEISVMCNHEDCESIKQCLWGDYGQQVSSRVITE